MACGQLLIRHGAIAGAEIHGLRQDLANAAAAADRLVVELNIRMGLVVFAEPLLVHRIRKSSACPVQSGLAESRYSQNYAQKRNAAYHAMVPPY